MTPIYVSYDKQEQRIQASVCVASYMAIDDAEIGRHEQLVTDVEQDPELSDEQRAERLEALDTEPFQYEPGEDDEVYQDITGERVPSGMYAFMQDGDLFLGAHEDCNWADAEQRTEAWETLKALLERNGFAPEWLHGSAEEA